MSRDFTSEATYTESAIGFKPWTWVTFLINYDLIWSKQFLWKDNLVWKMCLVRKSKSKTDMDT